MITTIKLNQEQHLLAFQKGLERQWEHRTADGERFGTIHKMVTHQNEFLADVAGCSAELAVSIYYGTKWNSDAWNIRDHKKHILQPDVEPYFEVRRVIRRNGDLTIRKSDADYKVAILAFVEYPENRTVTLYGGMSIKEARQRYTPDSKGNITVPQADLYPLDNFIPVQNKENDANLSIPMSRV
jgi:hypothetical protein